MQLYLENETEVSLDFDTQEIAEAVINKVLEAEKCPYDIEVNLLITDDEGNETTLLLSKQSKVSIGERYRFYFKKTTRVTLGNEYFDSALSSDCFLGYEPITEKA